MTCKTHGHEEVAPSVAIKITRDQGPDGAQLSGIWQRARLKSLTAAQQHERGQPACRNFGRGQAFEKGIDGGQCVGPMGGEAGGDGGKQWPDLLQSPHGKDTPIGSRVGLQASGDPILVPGTVEEVHLSDRTGRRTRRPRHQRLPPIEPPVAEDQILASIAVHVAQLQALPLACPLTQRQGGVGVTRRGHNWIYRLPGVSATTEHPGRPPVGHAHQLARKTRRPINKPRARHQAQRGHQDRTVSVAHAAKPLTGGRAGKLPRQRSTTEKDLGGHSKRLARNRSHRKVSCGHDLTLTVGLRDPIHAAR